MDNKKINNFELAKKIFNLFEFRKNSSYKELMFLYNRDHSSGYYWDYSRYRLELFATSCWIDTEIVSSDIEDLGGCLPYSKNGVPVISGDYFSDSYERESETINNTDKDINELLNYIFKYVSTLSEKERKKHIQ